MNDLVSYIEMLIKQQSEKDAEFKALLSKPNKSIRECAEYLQGEAYKEAQKGSGKYRCVGWSDEVMLNHIIHYYQEDGLKVKEEVKEPEPVKPVPAKETAKVVAKKTPKPKEEKEGRHYVQLSLF